MLPDIPFNRFEEHKCGISDPSLVNKIVLSWGQKTAIIVPETIDLEYQQTLCFWRSFVKHHPNCQKVTDKIVLSPYNTFAQKQSFLNYFFFVFFFFGSKERRTNDLSPSWKTESPNVIWYHNLKF